MSVIIRLQNLPWSANALDIRQFFQGLSIPEGGVHIVGGELGDAFIAFSTDEDARQAFCKSHGKIKEVQISLLLSSRTEMQKVIEAARSNQSLAPFMPTVPPAPSAPIMPAIVPSAVPEVTKKDDRFDRRDRRRSRTRSRDRKDRSYDRKRDRRRSRSKSRDRNDRSDRNRDRRRRDRSRSRERTRSRDRDRRNNRDRRPDEKTVSSSTSLTKEHRTNVWESPPSAMPGATSAKLLANFVANNILPNILTANINKNDNAMNVKGMSWHGGNMNNMQTDNNFMPDLGIDNNKCNPQMGNMNRNQINPNMNYQNFNQNQNMNNRGGPMNRDKNEAQPNSCVKVSPFFGGFGELRQFFKGVFIHNNGIKLINDSNGKRTGYAYIRFASYDGKVEALNRNGEKLKGATLNIQHLNDKEYDEAFDRFMPNDSFRRPRLDNFICLIVEDISPYTKDTDIMNMFSDFPTISVVIDSLPNKKCAYVKFKSKNEAMTAFMEKETHVIFGKNVRVEPCKEELFDKVRDEHIETVDLCDDSTSIISLTGLPFKCSDRDILDFFSDIGVRPAKTTLKMGDQGFTGDAVCEFFNVDDAILAFQKNGMPFGNGTVSMKYLEDNPIIPKPPIHNHNPNFLPMRPGMRMRAPFFPRNQFMGMPRGPPFRPPFFMGNRGPPPRRFPPPQMPVEEVEEDESLGPPGCVLLMENVPYKAGVNEILEFFEGFEIPAENILRKFNPNGSPSGEAKVIFNSADEVQQVIQTKRGGRIRERLIYMTQL